MRHASASTIGVLSALTRHIGACQCRLGSRVASRVQLVSTSSDSKPQDDIGRLAASHSPRFSSTPSSESNLWDYSRQSTPSPQRSQVHNASIEAPRGSAPDPRSKRPEQALAPGKPKRRPKLKHSRSSEPLWIPYRALQARIQTRLRALRTRRRQPRTSRPSPPQLGASVLLISPQNHVLLLHRVRHSSTLRTSSRSHPFLPGGRTSAFHDGIPPALDHPNRHKDDEVYRLTAIREIFAQVGILLARDPTSGRLINFAEAEREAARRDIVDNKVCFRTWLADRGATPDTDALIPFTRWITSARFSRRRSTQMYVYFLPTFASSLPEADQPVDTIPIAVPSPIKAQKRKHLVARFLPASVWLRLAQRRRIKMELSHFFLCHQIAQHLDELVTPTAYDTVSWDLLSRPELEERRDRLREFITETGEPVWRDKCLSITTIARRDSYLKTKHRRNAQVTSKAATQNGFTSNADASGGIPEPLEAHDEARSAGHDPNRAAQQTEQTAMLTMTGESLFHQRLNEGKIRIRIHRQRSVASTHLFGLKDASFEARRTRRVAVTDQVLALDARQKGKGRGTLAVISRRRLDSQSTTQTQADLQERRRRPRRFASYIGGGFGRGGRF